MNLNKKNKIFYQLKQWSTKSKQQIYEQITRTYPQQNDYENHSHQHLLSDELNFQI